MRLLVAASLMIAYLGAGLAGAPDATACDIADPFFVTAEHLVGDFNAPDSQLNRDYREWARDDTATIEITGVYVYESVYMVEGDDDWQPGSLNVAMEIWGEWPDDTEPQAIEPRRRDDVTSGDCGSGPSGMPVGQRVYSVVADTDAVVGVGEDTDVVLTAAFGAPDTAPRDAAAENDLIAQINATRRSTTRLFIGGGLAAVAIAGVVMYMSRTEPEISPEAEPSSI